MSFQESLREKITNEIVKSLEAGVSPWRRPWVGGMPMNLDSRKAYRGVNTLLLALHQHRHKLDSNIYATYNQWKKAGCQVKKRPEGVDEYGCAIIYFNPIKGTKKDKTTGEDVEFTFPLMKTYTVFNAAQVEGGAEVVEKRFPKIAVSPCEIHDEAERVFNAYINEYGIEYTEIEGRAVYYPTLDKINMPKRETFILGTNSYYGTKFHETIHSTGHESRLDRIKKFARFGSESYAVEELVAEIGGCFMLGALNLPVLDQLENHASYLATWLTALKNDHKLIFQASTAASAAADMVLKSAGLVEAPQELEAATA